MPLCDDSIFTAEWMTPAALASYVSFATKFFIIHQIMVPAQLENNRWQKRTSQS
jgi:hypothetical protein